MTRLPRRERAGSDQGGQRAATLHTLIATAYALGLQLGRSVREEAGDRIVWG